MPGLGWYLAIYRGKKVLYRPSELVGSAAALLMLPDRKFGAVGRITTSERAPRNESSSPQESELAWSGTFHESQLPSDCVLRARHLFLRFQFLSLRWSAAHHTRAASSVPRPRSRVGTMPSAGVSKPCSKRIYKPDQLKLLATRPLA